MAITNYERVGKAMEILRKGLGPFVERELIAVYKDDARRHAIALLDGDRMMMKKSIEEYDAAAMLKLVWEAWNDVFRRILGQSDRTIVSELRDIRNRWAHQEKFSGDDAYRALDSVSRLLSAVSAPEAQEVEKMKMEALRVRFEDQLRVEKRKSSDTAVESQVSSALKPWREVITPHKDVASGNYQQAEFAADLWQVHLNEGADEYRKPSEFFRRTYLTDGLQRLLKNAVERLSGQGGDPVVQLETNFGGGKTHSMLALYHLVSGVAPAELPGVENLLHAAGVSKLPKATRVVLVGNRISPGNPSEKHDGTLVRTLWGELAWQLGGKKAFERVQKDDELATSPGDVLRELFNEYGPCLILIDEWVAYARMLHDQSDLPAGSFETHFTFAQALTESARAAKDCLLVISIPASDTARDRKHARVEDVEVGGPRGREALERLRNVIGRMDAGWRPASAEEGFEIVRRRLFTPLVEKEHFVARDAVARAFYDLYRTQHQEFPPECRESDYERRLKAAYPIHPEIFDRLYNDWGNLVKFQRTRGVLRLMAAVIHSLWEKGDKNPLIMPCTIPIDDPRVQSELTRYLSDNWDSVIAKDVDGPNALPLRQDGEVSNLGKFHASRRVARTIYLGSAPTPTAANRGLEDRRVKLGCVMPGETPAIFGDALRRLAGSATYLYQDGNRYWYSTQPTVTKLAEDRAEQLKRDPDKVHMEIEARLRADTKKAGDIARVHTLPRSSQDVPDDLDTRMVVLAIEHPYSKEPNSSAEVAARAILETRGNAPRLYRNTLVFLAADRTRLQDLEDAVRRHLAWESILGEKETLDLSPHQVKQAETQRTAADRDVVARLPETYQWLLVPSQADPKALVELQAIRLSGQDPLVVRASKKLRNDDLLAVKLGATPLRTEMDKIPLWRGDHVTIRQLVEDFARYLYLQRVRDPDVVLEAISTGLGLLTWEEDSFAYAESYDEAAKRYRGLQCGQLVRHLDKDSQHLLVRPEVARRQRDEDLTKTQAVAAGTSTGSPPATVVTAGSRGGIDGTQATIVAPPRQPTRYHGTVSLNPTRVGRDASQIADEVITHLNGLVGANVRVTLEIEADVPSGTPENVVRIVTENSRHLKFQSHGFETD